jgi:ethanolamine utilization protein EutP (predicted NTPase)
MTTNVGNVKRGFTATPILAREELRSPDVGSAGEASRSTIGPLNGNGPWEFDDASPETWPDNITYTHFNSRSDQQSLHMASALASDSLVFGTSMPSDIVQARELLSALPVPPLPFPPHSLPWPPVLQPVGLILVQKRQAGEHGNVQKIAEFVKQDLQLGDRVFSMIREEKIDAHVVLACNKAELTDLGIRKLGDQKKLTLFARAALAKDAAIHERRQDILEAGAQRITDINAKTDCPSPSVLTSCSSSLLLCTIPDLGSYPPKPQSLFRPAQFHEDSDTEAGIIESLSPRGKPLLFF